MSTTKTDEQWNQKLCKTSAHGHNPRPQPVVWHINTHSHTRKCLTQNATPSSVISTSYTCVGDGWHSVTLLSFLPLPHTFFLHIQPLGYIVILYCLFSSGYRSQKRWALRLYSSGRLCPLSCTLGWEWSTVDGPLMFLLIVRTLSFSYFLTLQLCPTSPHAEMHIHETEQSDKTRQS